MSFFMHAGSCDDEAMGKGEAGKGEEGYEMWKETGMLTCHSVSSLEIVNVYFSFVHRFEFCKVENVRGCTSGMAFIAPLSFTV